MGLIPSASVPDSDYLLNRSTVEAAMAAKARSQPAAEAHHKIASCYLAKLFGGQSEAEMAAAESELSPLQSEPLELALLRFADVTSLPDNDELTRFLTRID